MAEEQGVGKPIGPKTLNQECLPEGATRPTGARIKVVAANGNVTDYWDFSCDDLATAGSELQRLKQQYCAKGDKDAKSGTAGDVELAPFYETDDKERTVRVTGPHGDVLFFGKKGQAAQNRLSV